MMHYYDLSTFVAKTTGGASITRLPCSSLSRDDKARLEVALSRVLLNSLAKKTEAPFGEPESTCPDDPPDVTVNVAGVQTGIELTELLPPNRLENDAIALL